MYDHVLALGLVHVWDVVQVANATPYFPMQLVTMVSEPSAILICHRSPLQIVARRDGGYTIPLPRFSSKQQSLSDHSKSAEKAEHTGASLGSGKSLSEPLESPYPCRQCGR